MIELIYEYSTVLDRYIPIYKFDKVIFKRIARLICFPKWASRIEFDNQIGVCTGNLITILKDTPKELLTNITQIKHYYKSTYLDFDFDKLISEIIKLQKYYNKYINIIGDSQQIESYCIKNIDLINTYFERCMVYYNTLHEIRKVISLNNFRCTLIEDLYHIMNSHEYEKYRKYLVGDKYKREELEQLIEYGRKIIVDDWQKQLSNISTCDLSNSFSFLFHVGYDPNVSQTFVSSTLLTNNLWCTYCGEEVGFIMSPEKIVAAYARDVYADNYASSVEDIIPRIPVPTILSKQKLEQDSLRDLMELDNGMNEIVTEGFNPLALLYIENSERSYKTKQLKKDQLLELRSIFSDLPVVKINKKTSHIKVLRK